MVRGEIRSGVRIWVMKGFVGIRLSSEIVDSVRGVVSILWVRVEVIIIFKYGCI